MPSAVLPESLYERNPLTICSKRRGRKSCSMVCIEDESRLITTDSSSCCLNYKIKHYANVAPFITLFSCYELLKKGLKEVRSANLKLIRAFGNSQLLTEIAGRTRSLFHRLHGSIMFHRLGERSSILANLLDSFQTTAHGACYTICTWRPP